LGNLVTSDYAWRYHAAATQHSKTDFLDDDLEAVVDLMLGFDRSVSGA
jgi:hypothetical protein